MSIDQQCKRNDQVNETPGAQRATISRIALEQSALSQARLAIARWSHSSSHAMRLAHLPAPAMAQAQWYDKTQREFQEWLGRGGFAQQDTACIETKMVSRSPALAPAPAPAPALPPTPYIILARAA